MLYFRWLIQIFHYFIFWLIIIFWITFVYSKNINIITTIYISKTFNIFVIRKTFIFENIYFS